MLIETRRSDKLLIWFTHSWLASDPSLPFNSSSHPVIHPAPSPNQSQLPWRSISPEWSSSQGPIASFPPPSWATPIPLGNQLCNHWNNTAHASYIKEHAPTAYMHRFMSIFPLLSVYLFKDGSWDWITIWVIEVIARPILGHFEWVFCVDL